MSAPTRRLAAGIATASFALLALAGCGSATATAGSPSASTAPPQASTSPVPTSVTATTAAPTTAAPSTAAPTTAAPTTTPTARAEVLTDCTTPAYEPSTITVTCGDGEDTVVDIHWERWSSTSASGTGVLHGDDCTPSCASGHPTSTPGSVALGQPTSTASGPVFATVTFQPASGGPSTTFRPGT